MLFDTIPIGFILFISFIFLFLFSLFLPLLTRLAPTRKPTYAAFGAMEGMRKYPDDKAVVPEETQDVGSGEVIDDHNGLKRHLSNRKIQMIAIGGSIGTAMFVSIGGALTTGGPASLLLAYGIYSCVIALVNNSMAEMAIYMPVNASFIRHASVWVDDAWGFMAGWNFFLYEAILIPFEISALNLVIKFWSDSVPVGAICAACIVTYGYLLPPKLLHIFVLVYYLCLVFPSYVDSFC